MSQVYFHLHYSVINESHKNKDFSEKTSSGNYRETLSRSKVCCLNYLQTPMKPKFKLNTLKDD